MNYAKSQRSGMKLIYTPFAKEAGQTALTIIRVMKATPFCCDNAFLTYSTAANAVRCNGNGEQI